MRVLIELATAAAAVVTVAGFYIKYMTKRRYRRHRALERLKELEERERRGELPMSTTHTEREEQ